MPMRRIILSSVACPSLQYFSTSHWRKNVTEHKMYFYILCHFCPQPLPKQVSTVRHSASSFNFQYFLISLRSFSSCLRLFTSSRPIYFSLRFPSVTYFGRQFLRKMWPIQIFFLRLISIRMFPFSQTLSNTSAYFTWSVQLNFSTTTFQNFPGIFDLRYSKSKFSQNTTNLLSVINVALLRHCRLQ